MEAAWRLAEERGPLSVTMSQVAEEAGIGRATLYKYFPDVESILVARHAGHVAQHLAQLNELRGRGETASARLVYVLGGYATICFHRGLHSSTEVATLVHRAPEMVEAERGLHGLMVELIEDAIAEGGIRRDQPAGELADYCLHALGAAARATDPSTVARLVDMVLAGIGCRETPPASVVALSSTHPGHRHETNSAGHH